MNLEFAVMGLPIPQGSKVVFGKRVVDANRDKLIPWRDAVTASAVLMLGGTPEWDRNGAMELHVTYWMPRPKSHHTISGGLRPSAPLWHAKRPDRDKLDRAVNDALTAAGVWLDDSQNAAGSSCKRYVDPNHPTPRAVIRVSHLED